MKSLLSWLIVAFTISFIGCGSRSVTSDRKPTTTSVKSDIEQRKFTVRVVSYDIVCAVLDAIPPENTVHLDCLVFDILAPEELKGKRWHLFIYNQTWSTPINYGYRKDDVLEIDVPKFGLSAKVLAETMASTEWMNSFHISNDLITKAHQ